MARISLSPGLVGKRVHQSGSVVSLIKRDSNQPLGRRVRLGFPIPVGNCRSSDASHALLRCQSRVKQPKASNAIRLRAQLLKSEDSDRDTRNGKDLLRYRDGLGTARSVEGFQRVGHRAFERAIGLLDGDEVKFLKRLWLKISKRTARVSRVL